MRRMMLLPDLNGLRHAVHMVRDRLMRSRDASMRVGQMIFAIRNRILVASDLLGQQLRLTFSLVEAQSAISLRVVVDNPCSALRKPTISSIIETTLPVGCCTTPILATVLDNCSWNS